MLTSATPETSARVYKKTWKTVSSPLRKNMPGTFTGEHFFTPIDAVEPLPKPVCVSPDHSYRGVLRVAVVTLPVVTLPVVNHARGKINPHELVARFTDDEWKSKTMMLFGVGMDYLEFEAYRGGTLLCWYSYVDTSNLEEGRAVFPELQVDYEPYRVLESELIRQLLDYGLVGTPYAAAFARETNEEIARLRQQQVEQEAAAAAYRQYQQVAPCPEIPNPHPSQLHNKMARKKEPEKIQTPSCSGDTR